MNVNQLINEAKLIWAVAPANYTGAACTEKYVSLKNYQAISIIIVTGAWAGGTAAVTLKQATAVAGTGAKALSFSTYYQDETTSGTLVATTATSNTFDLDTANKMYVIPVDPATLDVSNAFDCVSVAVATPGAVDDFYGALYVLHGNRFSEATPPSALTN